MNNIVRKSLLALIASGVFAVSFFSYQYIDGDTPQIQKVNKPKSFPAAATAPKEVEDVLRKAMPWIIKEGPIGGVDKGKRVSDFGRPFKVYVGDLAPVKTLDPSEKGAVTSIISPKYNWVYPLLDSTGKVVSSVVIEKDLEWGDWFVSMSAGRRAFELSLNGDKLTNYLADRGIAKAKETKRFGISLQGMHFIYINAAEGEYLLPLDLMTPENRRELREVLGRPTIELESRKLYPAAEALAKIIEWKINANVSDDGSPLTGPRPSGR